jgi:RHS repeat-associated protein
MGTVVAMQAARHDKHYAISGIAAHPCKKRKDGAPGSVTSLSNSSGALANTYTYDSFGKLTASTGTVTNPYRYTGREVDSETGLDYYRARYYDPQVGRFISEDPMGFAAGVNVYTYALNSPTNFRDPSGMDIAVIESGPTGLFNNPIGHSAIAVTGAGVYSFGNGWPAGSSLTDYLVANAEFRDTVVYVIHTTPDQDRAALAQLRKFPRNLPHDRDKMLEDNCSTRTNMVLDAAGIPFPRLPMGSRGGGRPIFNPVLPGSAGARVALGADAYVIPQGSTSVPGALLPFNPQ